jgi:hypothetical protein
MPRFFSAAAGDGEQAGIMRCPRGRKPPSAAAREIFTARRGNSSHRMGP